MAQNNSPEKAQQKALIAKERAAGKLAAQKLQGVIRNLIAVETVAHTGELLKTNVKPYTAKDVGLSKIYINGPHYGYKLNYGFLGVKEGGVQMRLKETAHISDAIESGSIIENLITEVAEIRADRIIAQVKF